MEEKLTFNDLVEKYDEKMEIFNQIIEEIDVKELEQEIKNNNVDIKRYEKQQEHVKARIAGLYQKLEEIEALGFEYDIGNAKVECEKNISEAEAYLKELSSKIENLQKDNEANEYNISKFNSKDDEKKKIDDEIIKEAEDRTAEFNNKLLEEIEKEKKEIEKLKQEKDIYGVNLGKDGGKHLTSQEKIAISNIDEKIAKIEEKVKGINKQIEKNEIMLKFFKENLGKNKKKVKSRVEEPKQEEPKQEEPKQEEPKQEERGGISYWDEEFKKSDSDMDELFEIFRRQPKPEQPKPEQPKPEQPKPEQPKPEQPKPEQPKPEQPKPEQPKPEQPNPEQPKPELPLKDIKITICPYTNTIVLEANDRNGKPFMVYKELNYDKKNGEKVRENIVAQYGLSDSMKLDPNVLSILDVVGCEDEIYDYGDAMDSADNRYGICTFDLHYDLDYMYKSDMLNHNEKRNVSKLAKQAKGTKGVTVSNKRNGIFARIGSWLTANKQKQLSEARRGRVQELYDGKNSMERAQIDREADEAENAWEKARRAFVEGIVQKDIVEQKWTHISDEEKEAMIEEQLYNFDDRYEYKAGGFKTKELDAGDGR